MIMLGFLIALLSGALMSIQGVWNTGATKQSGVWLVASFVQITAFVVCAASYLFFERPQVSLGSLWAIKPKYFLLSGVLGAIITITVVKSIHLLGAAQAEMSIVAFQLIVAYIIELFGLFGMKQADFSVKKIFAVILFLISIWIFKSK